MITWYLPVLSVTQSPLDSARELTPVQGIIDIWVREEQEELSEFRGYVTTVFGYCGSLVGASYRSIAVIDGLSGCLAEEWKITIITLYQCLGA
jgi:hypothetical protein